MSKHYVGETGTEIRLDTGILIGSATSQYIKTYSPTGVTGTFTASLYDSYSQIAKATGTYFLLHTLATSDFNVSGVWKFQAFIGTANGTWYGETVKLNVYDIFE